MGTATSHASPSRARASQRPADNRHNAQPGPCWTPYPLTGAYSWNATATAKSRRADHIETSFKTQLYGRSNDALNILCEDDAAEGILQGAFDYLAPRLRLARGSIRIGRDTGADEISNSCQGV